MTARNSGTAIETTRARRRLTACCALLLGSLIPAQEASTKQDPAKEIARLSEQLKQPGADGKEARDQAIERLLSMPVVEAHRVLTRVLALPADPDGMRSDILAGLRRQLLLPETSRFGGADASGRRQIFSHYLSVLSRWWLPADVPPLRSVAVRALQLIPGRDLEASARSVLAQADAEAKTAMFACLADLQNLHVSRLLAEFLTAEDLRVRTAARRSLRLLTFHDREFQTREQFDEWFQAHRDTRYVDLAQEVARAASKRIDEIRAQVDAALIDRSRSVVRALVTPSQHIQWAGIQKETLVSDLARMRACLEVLQDVLAKRPPTDETPARSAFCRALLDRWEKTPPERSDIRARLLEVAAYAVRAGEADLAPRIRGLLVTELDRPDREVRLASLRGLRRFPSPEARAVIVAHARALAGDGGSIDLLRAALSTLSSQADPPWTAPGPDAADKNDWLELVRTVFRRPEFTELRTAAFELMLLEHDGGERLPEVFDLLLGLAEDPNQSVQLRCNSIIQLQRWHGQRGTEWIKVLHRLIADPNEAVREKAAGAIGELVRSSSAEHKVAWLSDTIAMLRERLAVEEKMRVFDPLVESLTLCGFEAQMAGPTIAAAKDVLLGMKGGSGEDRQRKQSKLVSALVRIASHKNASANEVWLEACEPLLALGAGNRRNLTMLLYEKHSAMALRDKVANEDAGVAARAQRAMQFVIRTALLKPAAESWKNPANAAEAQAALAAFLTLDKVPGAALDAPPYRLLRLDLELAAGHHQQVVDQATAWLAEAGSWKPEERHRARAVLIEAHLVLQHPGLAAAELDKFEPEHALDGRDLALISRVARELTSSDAKRAVDLFDRVRKATPEADRSFPERLVDWAAAAVALDPAQRAAVWKELAPHASRFAEGKVAPELRAKFETLRVKG